MKHVVSKWGVNTDATHNTLRREYCDKICIGDNDISSYCPPLSEECFFPVRFCQQKDVTLCFMRTDRQTGRQTERETLRSDDQWPAAPRVSQWGRIKNTRERVHSEHIADSSMIFSLKKLMYTRTHNQSAFSTEFKSTYEASFLLLFTQLPHIKLEIWGKSKTPNSFCCQTHYWVKCALEFHHGNSLEFHSRPCGGVTGNRVQ